MRRIMHRLPRILTVAAVAGLLVGSAPSAFAQRHRIVVIQQVPVIDPFFFEPYGFYYPPYYVDEYYGYIKIDPHHQRAALYVDGGYADQLHKTKKFALRPGTHKIELRDPDGRKVFQERVAVIVGKTTKVDVPQFG